MHGTDKLFDYVKKAVNEGRSIEELEAELDQHFGETCAAMVMDSTGFTRAAKALGMAYFLAIICHLREICETIVRRRGAVDFRAHADNFYAEFPGPDHAVRAAFDIHRYFDENPVALLNRKDTFGVCAGIGYGRVLRSEHEGVYGNEMNFASKLGEDVAERGETLLTQNAFQALSNPDSLLVEERGIEVSGVEMTIFSVLEKSLDGG